MKTFFKTTILAHVGASNYNPEGTTLQFTVCHNEDYKDKNGAAQKKTTWVNCFYNNIKPDKKITLEKGCVVLVEGNLKISVYQDKDNNYVPSISITVTKLVIVGKIQAIIIDEGNKTQDVLNSEQILMLDAFKKSDLFKNTRP